MTSTHIINLPTAAVLCRMQRKGRKVRYWFDAGCTLVGIWQSPTGRTYAVASGNYGASRVYRAMDLFQNQVRS